MNLIWRYLIVNCYRIYLQGKRIVTDIYYRYNNNLAILLNKKIITTLIIVVVTSLIVTNNLAAKETTRDEFGRDTLLFNLVRDELGEAAIIEDNNPAQTNKATYVPKDADLESVTELNPNAPIDLSETDNLTVSQGGSALVKQNLTAPDQPRTRTEVETYTVQPGDTASSIARTFGLSVNTILWSNDLSSYSIIRPGDTLSILPQDGVIHTIAKGDTIKSIADKYQGDEIEIIEANDLDPSALTVGKKILVPGGAPPAPKIVPRTTQSTSIVSNIFTPPPAADPNTNTKLLWPANSHRINQYYSWRHRGLDIDGDIGDPAYAPESGKIIKAGWGTGYGNHVIIDHGNGIVTLMGHMSKLLVEAGDAVSRGDVVALIGSTGWSTGPHIHLEVRVNGEKMNPLSYTK